MVEKADGKQNFKTYLHFLNFKLSSPSGTYIANIIGVACNSQIPRAIWVFDYLLQ
jgi:hypothetical protein